MKKRSGYCECDCGEKTGIYRGVQNRFVKGHNAWKLKVPYRIDRRTGCWMWLLQRSEKGYPIVSRNGESPKRAHRVYFEKKHGRIPLGKELDHDCRRRACVNPDHVEPVTHKENIRRRNPAWKMGYWISKAGRVFQVPDHFEFVKAHLKLFGLPKVVAEFGVAQRQATLDEVIAKGWIRARGDRRQGLTFEVCSLSPDTLFNIREFLIKEKWDATQKVLVDEVSSGSTMFEPASFFTSDEALAVARNPRRKRRLTRR